MGEFSKPKVVVSKCLGFQYCRCNGLIISSKIVDKLRSYIDFNPVCPELEM